MHLSLNKFFDPNTPSIRKGRDRGGGDEEKEENNDENNGHYVIAS